MEKDHTGFIVYNFLIFDFFCLFWIIVQSVSSDIYFFFFFQKKNHRNNTFSELVITSDNSYIEFIHTPQMSTNKTEEI